MEHLTPATCVAPLRTPRRVSGLTPCASPGQALRALAIRPTRLVLPTSFSVAAVTNAAYGALILADTDRSFKAFFNQSSSSLPASAVGVAKFDGLALLQNAAVCLAVSRCDDKKCRRALNAAIAVNHVADAAMTQYQARKHGLDATQANISTAITLGVGAYAAWHVWRDFSKEAEDKKRADEAVATLKRAM
jgi:hypothetical protein